MSATDYRDLIAWKKAFESAVKIYEETAKYPVEEKYGLKAQLRRAGVSVPSNIAEGEGRNVREFLRYLSIALGSLKELETQLLISDALGFLQPEQAATFTKMTAEVGRLINGLSRSLRNSRRPN